MAKAALTSGLQPPSLVTVSRDGALFTWLLSKQETADVHTPQQPGNGSLHDKAAQQLGKSSTPDKAAQQLGSGGTTDRAAQQGRSKRILTAVPLQGDVRGKRQKHSNEAEADENATEQSLEYLGECLQTGRRCASYTVRYTGMHRWLLASQSSGAQSGMKTASKAFWSSVAVL